MIVVNHLMPLFIPHHPGGFIRNAGAGIRLYKTLETLAVAAEKQLGDFGAGVIRLREYGRYAEAAEETVKAAGVKFGRRGEIFGPECAAVVLVTDFRNLA